MGEWKRKTEMNERSSALDKTSDEPLYIQLYTILQEEIESLYHMGDQIDSEREICLKYGVSRTTVRLALELLEKRGYIDKVQGKGNFVSKPKISQDLMHFYSFTEEMIKMGRVPSSELAGFEVIEASEGLAARMELSHGEKVYKIDRIRYADHIPVMQEVSYLPYDRFTGLSRDRLLEESIYKVMNDEFDVKISNAEEYLNPVLINRLESLLLETPEGGPGLKITRITREGGRIIEYTNGIARGDKFTYRVNLEIGRAGATGKTADSPSESVKP